MPNTYIDYTAPQASYTFPFDYLDVSNVKVYVNGSPRLQGTEYTVQTSPTKAIVFTAGNTPASGSTVRIRRETYREAPLVDFVNGSTLIESDLDIAVKQTLFINQEVAELNDTNLAIGAGTNKYDALNKNIANLANPTSSLEAANKAYVDQSISNAGSFGSTVPPTKYTLTGNGATTTFTLTGINAQNPTNYLVSVNGSVLEPAVDYTVNVSAQTITFTTAPANGAKVVVINIGYKVPTEISVPIGSIGPSALQDGAVTTAKLDGTSGSEAVTTAKIRNLAVTSDKLAASSVIGGKLASRASVAAGTIASRANTGAPYIISLNPSTYNVLVGDTITLRGASSSAANGVTYTVSAVNAPTNFSVTGGTTTAQLTGAQVHFLKDQPVDGNSIRPLSIVNNHLTSGCVFGSNIANGTIGVTNVGFAGLLWGTGERLVARAAFNGQTATAFTAGTFTLNNGSGAAGTILTINLSALTVAYNFDVGHRLFIDFVPASGTVPADGIYTIATNNNDGTYTLTNTTSGLASGTITFRLLGDANGAVAAMDNVSNIACATATNAGDYFVNLGTTFWPYDLSVTPEDVCIIGHAQRASATTAVGGLQLRNEASPNKTSITNRSVRLITTWGATPEAPYYTSVVLLNNA